MYRSFEMKFVDRIFRYNNVLELSFWKVLSRKSDKMAELAEDACAKVLDKEFIDIFTLLAQDLAVLK